MFKRLRARMGYVLMTSASVVAFPDPTSSVAAEQAVVLQLTSYKSAYVLHEPLHFSGEIINNTDRPVRIYDMDFFDENMRCLFLEVIAPEGEKREVKTLFSMPNYGVSERYIGVPVEPGRRFGFDIFPNQTSSTHPESGSAVAGGWTFPAPGEYKVRLVYVVEELRANLWKPAGNRLYSNQITIHVAEPGSAEREILDAYWKNVFPDGMAWDGLLMWGFDKEELNRVLLKYPTEPFLQYVRFALLHEASMMAAPDLAEAEKHARYLMSHSPDFRPGQVRKQYAAALIASGREAEGLRVLEEALSIVPHMKDDLSFMKLKITYELGKGDEKAFWQWKKTRMMEGERSGKDAKIEKE